MQTDPPAQRQHLVSEIGSERATSGAGNKIVTHGGRTHVVWQDVTEEGYFNRVRTIDRATGQWSDPFTLNAGKDNHARPVVTLDHEGYLHAVMSGHNSPVTHRRSVRPNDSSEWTPEAPAGSGTYPAVACAADDTLYLTMRSADRWNGVDFHRKPKDGEWRMAAKLVYRPEEYPGYAGYQTALAVGPDGTLHFLCDFYEGRGVYEERGMHQAVCCLRSRDGGDTWEKADGTAVELPARPEQMDALARDTRLREVEMPPPELLAQGCLVVGSDARPRVLYISHREEPGGIVLATAEDGEWRQEPVAAVAEAFPQMRPVGCRGALTMDEADGIHALLSLVPPGEGWQDGKPTRGLNFLAGPHKRLVWLCSEDGGRTWTLRPALEPGTPFNQANAERPTGVNTIPAGRTPPFLYFDGTSRYAEEGEIIQNNVYLVLPYD